MENTMAERRLIMTFQDGTVEDISVLSCLGKGAFGVVSKVCNQNGLLYALKTIICSKETNQRSATQEIRCLTQLNHNYIVKIFATDFRFNCQPKIYILMEYCGGGNLNDKLNGASSVELSMTWMVQVADAIKYLHEKNIVHRDLKPDNILLSTEMDIKVADFGLARTFVHSKGSMDDWISSYLDAYMGTLAGSPFWVAPEVFFHHYTEKADIFSLGVIFYSICERKYITFGNKYYYGAFSKVGQMSLGIGQVMANGSVKDASKLIEFDIKGSTRNIKELILSMLEHEPLNRPSADVVHKNIIHIRKKYFVKRLHEDNHSNDHCF